MVDIERLESDPSGVDAAMELARSGEPFVVGTPVVVDQADQGIFLGVVCSIRNDTLDIANEHGSLEEVAFDCVTRRYPIRRVGDKVEVLPDGSPATICSIHDAGHSIVVAFEDGRQVVSPVENLTGGPEHTNDFSEMELPRLNGLFYINIPQARGLPKSDISWTMRHKAGDPYCRIYDAHGRHVTGTDKIEDTCDPYWNFRSEPLTVGDSEYLRIVIKDWDIDEDEVICEGRIDHTSGLAHLANGLPFSGWITLYGKGDRAGEIQIEVRRVESRQAQSILEEPTTRFPMRRGCRVVLYQSAHIGEWAERLAPLTVYEGEEVPREGKLHREYPEVKFDWQNEDNEKPEGPIPYMRRNCWVELVTAILEAKEFIYVVGWSVNTDITLMREDIGLLQQYPEFEGSGREDNTVTVGSLLIAKAKAGVTVSVMVWGEKTSIDGYSEGMAGTRSGQTVEYFRDTGVVAIAAERDEDDPTIQFFITHHQKGIMCDAPQLEPAVEGYEDRRRVVAFMGGLDITGGRYDDPGKELYSTLKTKHRDDFYQNTVADLPVDEEGIPVGPRQPWQDIHLKIEGRAAYDIVHNFEKRWVTHGTYLESIYKVPESDRILHPEMDLPMDPMHPEAWDVQYFRSINRFSDSVVHGTEADCNQAWITAIERSERFIFIENQYFIGSSKLWREGRTGCTPVNKIPMVIVNRAKRAIAEGRDWCAYIITPMFPEGIPDAGVTQEIIHFQYRTMEMMYHEIAKVLPEGKHPTDYLNFYCLGKREPSPDTPIMECENERTRLVMENRRMQIYVHSK
eukprot:Sspe_Gene.31196::Locus_15396_Transcript_1_1_Confidence_1.000_Length_2453::g.31196::m.31196/K01115/PLD1_2; phospholipase D1/2